MKSIKVSFLVFVAVCAIMMLGSCTKKAEQYTEALPNGSVFVMSFDVKSLAAKIGDASVSAKFKELILEDLNAEAKSKIGKILKNPATSGVDLSAPVFCFIDADDFIVGALAKVSNAKKITSVLELGGDAIKHSEGINYMLLGNDHVICYDDSKLMVMSNMQGASISSDALLDICAGLFAQEGEQPLNREAGFTEFLSKKKDIAMWQNSTDNYKLISSFGKIIGQDIPVAKAVNLPKGLGSVCDVSFDKGEIVCQVNSYANTKEAEEYVAIMDSYLGKFNGDILKNIPGQSIFNLGFNIDNGTKLLDLISEYVPESKSAITMLQQEGIDLYALIASLKGDLFMNISDLSLTTQKMTIMANVTNTEIGDLIVSTFGNYFVEEEEGIYSFQGMVTLYNRDGLFVITTDPEVVPALKTGLASSFEDTKDATLYHNAYSACCLNVNELFSFQLINIIKTQEKDVAVAADFLNIVDRIECVMKKPSDSDLVVYMTDTEKNSLAEIVDKVASFIQ